jgi:hypothetical protein
MKTIPFLPASLTLCCLFSVPSRAEEILLGTPHVNVLGGGGGSVSPTAAVAEGSYLTQPITLTGINAGIFTDTGSLGTNSSFSS